MVTVHGHTHVSMGIRVCVLACVPVCSHMRPPLPIRNSFRAVVVVVTLVRSGLQLLSTTEACWDMWWWGLVNHQPPCQICSYIMSHDCTPFPDHETHIFYAGTDKLGGKWWQMNKHVKHVYICFILIICPIVTNWRWRPVGVRTPHASDYSHRWFGGWFALFRRNLQF